MLQRFLSASQVFNTRTLHQTTVFVVGRSPTPPCFATISAGKTRLPMSKLLEVKDFGPTGFRWLTLKRIYVRPYISSDMTACSPTALLLQGRAIPGMC